MKKLFIHVRERGVWWTQLFIQRLILLSVQDKIFFPWLRWLQKKMVACEMQNHLVGEATMSAKIFDQEYNRKFYDQYDWSKAGDEWTDDVRRYKGLDPEAWKTMLVNEMLVPKIPRGSVALEIGPGGGRWTEVLLPVCSTLHVADISEKCLEICRKRFEAVSNIKYHLIINRLDFLADACLDAIWSYDVFVHINPTEIDCYLKEFRRILKPGGVAVIHHAGNYRPEQAEMIVAAGRSPMNRGFFAELVGRNGLELVEQNDELVHLEGDTITVFRKKGES